MIEEIERIAKLLETDGLEPESSQLINKVLRGMLMDYEVQLSAPKPDGGAGVLIPPAVFDEWLNGRQAPQQAETG